LIRATLAEASISAIFADLEIELLVSRSR